MTRRIKQGTHRTRWQERKSLPVGADEHGPAAGHRLAEEGWPARGGSGSPRPGTGRSAPLRPGCAGIELHGCAAALAADGDRAHQGHRARRSARCIRCTSTPGPARRPRWRASLSSSIRQPQQRRQILRGLGEHRPTGRSPARASGSGSAVARREQRAEPVPGAHVAELGAAQRALHGLVGPEELRLHALLGGQRLGGIATSGGRGRRRIGIPRALPSHSGSPAQAESM